MATHGAWVVFFRPDADGRRDEIVVEYGSRFTFGSLPPTTASGIAPVHILAPYMAWGRTPVMRSVPNAGPMTPGGLQTGMGTPGDRPELGHVTEYQAAWLVAGDPKGRVSMLTQSEAAGSMCIHIRDAAGNAPLDVQRHPYLGQIFGPAPHRIPLAPRLTYAQDPHYFNTQCAHYPDVAFVPWLLTDDPYLLEECQFNALYHSTEGQYHQALNKLPGMVQPSETRGWAWGLRDIMNMAAFAPETLPSWLLPRSRWQANLADCLTYAKKYVASATPGCSVFRLMTQGNVLSSWMIGYHASVLGRAKWSGLFPEWNEVASYVLDVILKLNADPALGGWDRRWPAPYQVNVLGLRSSAPAGGGDDR